MGKCFFTLGIEVKLTKDRLRVRLHRNLCHSEQGREFQNVPTIDDPKRVPDRSRIFDWIRPIAPCSTKVDGLCMDAVDVNMNPKIAPTDLA